jgi:hypothetical protein
MIPLAVYERGVELERLMLAKPFVPFTIVMEDGDRLEVLRPLACAFCEDLLYVRMPGRSVRTRMHKIVAFEVPSSASTSGE